MWNLFHSWWREGETPDATVYRGVWWTPLTVGLVFALFYWLVPTYRTWYVDLIFTLGLARSLFERRRALILSSTRLNVRPALGTSRGVSIEEIVGLRTCSATVSFFLAPRWVKGVDLELRSGEHLCVPLDFLGSSTVSARLAKLAGIPWPAAPIATKPQKRDSAQAPR